MAAQQRDRLPAHLHPDILPLYYLLLDQAADLGINVKPVGIWGDPSVQDALYAQGRTVPGKIVTDEKGTGSKHCFCLPDGTPASKAFDLGVFDDDWNYIGYGDDDRYLKLGALWKAMIPDHPTLGMVWGGDWHQPHDTDHFQIA